MTIKSQVNLKPTFPFKKSSALCFYNISVLSANRQEINLTGANDQPLWALLESGTID